jgi:type I site-specific restriction endonuclease
VNKPNSTVNEMPSGPSALLSYEDIYRAAGIMSPGAGYGIHKVVEMMNNERIRDLSKDVKRASVLMALDAAGIAADDLLTDATRRQNALNSYEVSQRKQLEDFEARKARENARIEEEMEKVRSHYAERVQANLDQVAKEKDALRNWQMAMQHESQRIAEVIELCGKQPAPVRPTALATAAGAHGTEKP